jgi:hypothetical protein
MFLISSGRGKSSWRGNLLKMSMEGTKEEAYFALIKGGRAMFEVGLIVLGEVVVYSLLPISKAKRLPEELLSKPGQSLLCSRAFVP